MKLTVIHPSRGRARRCKQVYDNWMSKFSSANTIEYLLTLDSDDAVAEYKIAFKNCPVNIIVNNNKSMVDAVNHAATFATGGILILVSDDFECPSGWDKIIVNAFTDTDRVLKTYDGLQEWIVTFPVMDMTYYKGQGYFYYPEYKHMFCDTDMTHKADLERKLILRNDITFRHHHYSLRRRNFKDEVSLRADATWAQGEEVYLRRCKERFGTDRDIFDINPIGLNSIKWLRRKLK